MSKEIMIQLPSLIILGSEAVSANWSSEQVTLGRQHFYDEIVW